MRDATISLAITPSLPVPVKYDIIVTGGWGPSAKHRRVQSVEMLLTLLRVTSISVEGQGSRALPQSIWRVHR